MKDPRKKLNADAIEITVGDITEKFRRLLLDESKEFTHKAFG